MFGLLVWWLWGSQWMGERNDWICIPFIWWYFLEINFELWEKINYMKFWIQITWIYLLLLSLFGVVFFGHILISRIFSFQFQSIEMWKREENSGVWAVLFCYFLSLASLILTVKKLDILQMAQFQEFQRVTTKIFHQFFDRDRESRDLLRRSSK